MAGDANGVSDIFVANRATGAVTLVSQTGGVQGNSVSENPSISDNGQYVAFASYSNNLVPGDTNNHEDVFLANLQTGTMMLVSQNPAGDGADGASNFPAISGDGRSVAFTSQATNLVSTDPSQFANIFVDSIAPAPNIVVTIPDSIDAGDSLPLDASQTTSPEGDTLTYSWDINGDGVYGDATGAVVNLTWAQLESFGFDTVGFHTMINLQVTDLVRLDHRGVPDRGQSTRRRPAYHPRRLRPGPGADGQLQLDRHRPEHRRNRRRLHLLVGRDRRTARPAHDETGSSTSSTFSFPIADERQLRHHPHGHRQRRPRHHHGLHLLRRRRLADRRFVPRTDHRRRGHADLLRRQRSQIRHGEPWRSRSPET